MKYLVKAKPISSSLKSLLNNQKFNYNILQLTKIEAILKSVIPANISCDTKLANYRDNTLIIIVSSPAIKYKLQLEKTKILSKLNSINKLFLIKDLKVKVDTDFFSQFRPKVSNGKPPILKKRKSSQSLGHISVAQSSVANEKLKKSLDKLAATIKKNS